MPSRHPDRRIVEMSQEGVERVVLGNHVGAHQDEHGALRRVDEEINGGCFTFAARLHDEAYARFPAGDLGDDGSGPVFAAAGHHYYFCDPLRGQLLVQDAVQDMGDISFFVVGHDAHAAF